MRNNSILARADALMNRRRQTPAQDEVPVLTDVLDEEDDDIPVLLDTETPGDAETHTASTMAPQPETHAGPEPEASSEEEENDHNHDEMIIRELTRRLEQRLVAELPRLIESTLREFVAEQEEAARQQSHD